MATHTLQDWRGMQQADLLREVATQRGLVARMRMGVRTRASKDTAAYRREKKRLARMMTVLTSLLTSSSRS